jgi:hypothetical protein
MLAEYHFFDDSGAKEKKLTDIAEIDVMAITKMT